MEITYNIERSPTLQRFHASRAFVRGVRGPIGCMRGADEYLSPTGWKRMDEYDGGLVMGWNPETGVAEFVRPLDYVVLPSTGWYKFSRNRFSMTVSPEHRFYVSRLFSKWRRNEWHDVVMNAEELSGLVSQVKLFSTFTVKENEDPSDDLIRFAVALNADGSIVKDCANTVSFGFSKDRKKKRLVEILNNLGFRYTSHDYEKYTTFRVKCNGYLGKTFDSPFFWSLGAHGLRVVVDELEYWDGCRKPSSVASTPAISFSTTRKSDIGFLQYAGSACDYRVTVNVEPPREDNHKPQYSLQFIPPESLKHRISFRRGGVDVEFIPPVEGELKYCFTMPTGHFIARVGCETNSPSVLCVGNSGKSVACCMEIVRRALEQKKFNGVRKTRWAVIRNTGPELKSTTIKTWSDWVKPDVFGPVKWSAPITHKIKLQSDVELEVIFLALDRPEDIRKLLSLEVTGIWINEAREIPKAVVDAATGRVGRYPSMMEGGASWSGIIMDTNSCDDEHWWYKMAEELNPDDWEFFDQPSALTPGAENLENLPRNYYQRMLAGKDDEWIKIYVKNEYGSVMEGKPVWPEFSYAMHVSEIPLSIYKGLPLIGGMDFGLTPSVIFGQVSPFGQIRLLREVVGTDIGVKQLINQRVKPLLTNEFHDMDVRISGDPAGIQRAQSDESTCFDMLHDAGFKAFPAHTNNFLARREAVADYLNLTIDGQPGIIVDKQCKVLIKALNGGYKYRLMQVPGEYRFAEKPDKNRFSHIAEGLQYFCLSADSIKASAATADWKPPRKKCHV